MNENLVGSGNDVKNIDLCDRIDGKLAVAVAHDKSDSTNAKVTMASITEYNQNLVFKKPSDKSSLCQLHQHKRLHKMMESGAISKDNMIWLYIDNFKSVREQEMAKLEARIPEEQWLGSKRANYDAAGLKDYFADVDSDDVT